MQFLAAEDSFVFSKVVCGADAAATLTSWTAARRGAPRRQLGAAGAKPEGKRSMLQRYGWYLLAAIGYAGYKAAKGGAAPSSKKK